MYLRAIEIVGFKSFADRTRIDLRPGISGIIGPNGSGKSNIVDAIRWCVGEMSYKSLRSSSMVSVIFTGSARRNPMGLAEVSLIFDNAQSLLPVQYSEVSVTRRIYRSGESEYQLNKTQCRLRDIRELFFDTGIGNDGYAIIDQGGVDFVLKSKPEDRRALFEEAAGVAKYKAKREEALRKLDRVEIDLGRLQDSLSLINEQIKKLDSDARKAKLYQKYRTELKAMEASQLLQEITRIDTEVREEEARIAPETERLAALRSAIDADDARLSALALERSAQESAVREANEKISGRKSEVSRLEERIENAKNAQREIASQLEVSRKEGEREAENARSLEPDIEDAKKLHDQALASMQEARTRVEAFEAELKSAESERERADSELQDIRTRMMSAVQAGQDASRELSSSKSRLSNIDYSLRQNLKELEKKGGLVDVERTHVSGHDDSVASQEAAAARAREAAAEVEAIHEEVRSALSRFGDEGLHLHGRIQALRAKIEALEAQGGADPYWAGAQAVCDAGIPGILGTVRSMLDIDDSWRGHVEDALGERLYAVVCDGAAAAKAGIEFLKEGSRGRARFLVACSLPEAHPSTIGFPPGARPVVDHVRFDPAHERVMRFLLADTYAVDDGLYSRHWISGGSSSGGASLKLSDLDGLRRELAETEKLAEELARRKAQKQAEESTSELRVGEARAAVVEQTARLRHVSAERDRKLEYVRALEDEYSVVETEAVTLLRDAADTLERIAENGKALETHRAQERELQGLESESGKNAARLGEVVAGKRVEKGHLETALGAELKSEQLTRQTFEKLGAQRDSLLQAIERRRERQASAEARIKEFETTEAESKAGLETLRTELAGLENESKSLFETLQKTEQAHGELDGVLKRKKREAEAAQEKVHRAEVKVSGLKSRQEMHRARLTEEWQLDEERARETYKDQEVVPERMEFLRRRIQSLGHVNLAAPEEYEELAKRRDHLQGQIDDLSQAKADLHSVINKINATTRENFRQTFHEVREHFRKLYGVLFEGGEADLVFTNKENLLETGIDIVAQPPGKRLQSISQLSGGEKALTAIALLFSFFMVRPSPFCMLDEADAALDDANIERFLSLLREFAGKTQFVIVSHNKKTMEACDVIYGITMEESGVSQVISVDLAKDRPGETAAPPGEGAAETGEPVTA